MAITGGGSNVVVQFAHMHEWVTCSVASLASHHFSSILLHNMIYFISHRIIFFNLLSSFILARVGNYYLVYLPLARFMAYGRTIDLFLDSSQVPSRTIPSSSKRGPASSNKAGR